MRGSRDGEVARRARADSPPGGRSLRALKRGGRARAPRSAGRSAGCRRVARAGPGDSEGSGGPASLRAGCALPRPPEPPNCPSPPDSGRGRPRRRGEGPASGAAPGARAPARWQPGLFGVPAGGRGGRGHFLRTSGRGFCSLRARALALPAAPGPRSSPRAGRSVARVSERLVAAGSRGPRGSLSGFAPPGKEGRANVPGCGDALGRGLEGETSRARTPRGRGSAWRRGARGRPGPRPLAPPLGSPVWPRITSAVGRP